MQQPYYYADEGSAQITREYLRFATKSFNIPRCIIWTFHFRDKDKKDTQQLRDFKTSILVLLLTVQSPYPLETLEPMKREGENSFDSFK
jgi:hypothetical protein